MTSVLRHHRYGRALAVGALSVALLSGGTAGALAATSTPSPTTKPTTAPTGMTTSSPTTGMASITITAKPTSVKSGQTVLFTGRTTGLKVGSPLVLQQRQTNGKWMALRATGKVKTGSSYAISAKLTKKGTQTLRVASVNQAGRVHSPTVTVTVS